LLFVKTKVSVTQIIHLAHNNNDAYDQQHRYSKLKNNQRFLKKTPFNPVFNFPFKDSIGVNDESKNAG
jgi:hypothetical protein